MALDPFWTRPVRMIQPNLRMTDARGLDGARLVRQCRDHGANAVLANGGGIVAWYPTSLPYQWRNPLLGPDFVGAATREAGRLGMKVLLRMDWSCLIPDIGRKHRDWLALDASGKPVVEWARSRDPLLRTCPNRPYWQEYAPRELEELMSRYPVDGFFFNAWDLPDCRCPECRAACRKELGEEPGPKVDWNSAFGKAFLLWREKRRADFTKRLNRRIKRFSPNVALTVDYHLTNDNPHHLGRAGWDGALLTDAVDMVTVEAFNFLDRSRPHWPYWAAEEAQMIGAFPQGKPGIVLLSGSERWYGRRPAQPPEQLAVNILQITGYGAHPCFAMSGDFRQEDRKDLPVVKQVFRALERGERRMSSRPLPRAQVALVYGQRTMDLYGGDASRERALFHYRGWYEALAENGTRFTVIHDGALGAVLEGHPVFRTLVMPNVACLGDAECRAIEKWVARGGMLVADFETSRYDERGRLRRGFGLRLFDRRPGRVVRFTGSWFTVAGRGRRWVGSHTSILPVAGEFLTTSGGRGELALMEWEYNNKPEWSRPHGWSGQWGLFERRHGRGLVRYLPWTPGKLFHLCRSGEHRELVKRLISRAR